MGIPWMYMGKLENQRKKKKWERICKMIKERESSNNEVLKSQKSQFLSNSNSKLRTFIITASNIDMRSHR